MSTESIKLLLSVESKVSEVGVPRYFPHFCDFGKESNAWIYKIPYQNTKIHHSHMLTPLSSLTSVLVREVNCQTSS